MTIPNRFRYRLWDEGANRHCSAETIRALGLTLSPDGKILFKCVGETHESTCFTPEFSTGLLDKNGKEIFEGDILQFKNQWMPEPAILGYLKYDPERFSFTLATDLDPYSMGGLASDALDNCFFESEKVEIIGNIHKNPELLK